MHFQKESSHADRKEWVKDNSGLSRGTEVPVLPKQRVRFAWVILASNLWHIEMQLETPKAHLSGASVRSEASQGWHAPSL